MSDNLTLQQQIDQLNKMINQQNKMINQQKKNFEQQIDQQKQKYEQQVDQQNKMINQLKKEFDQQNKMINQQNKIINQQKKNFEQVDQQKQKYEQELNQANAQLKKLERQKPNYFKSNRLSGLLLALCKANELECKSLSLSNLPPVYSPVIWVFLWCAQELKLGKELVNTFTKDTTLDYEEFLSRPSNSPQNRSFAASSSSAAVIKVPDQNSTRLHDRLKIKPDLQAKADAIVKDCLLVGAYRKYYSDKQYKNMIRYEDTMNAQLGYALCKAIGDKYIVLVRPRFEKAHHPSSSSSSTNTQKDTHLEPDGIVQNEKKSMIVFENKLIQRMNIPKSTSKDALDTKVKDALDTKLTEATSDLDNYMISIAKNTGFVHTLGVSIVFWHKKTGLTKLDDDQGVVAAMRVSIYFGYSGEAQSTKDASLYRVELIELRNPTKKTLTACFSTILHSIGCIKPDKLPVDLPCAPPSTSNDFFVQRNCPSHDSTEHVKVYTLGTSRTPKYALMYLPKSKLVCRSPVMHVITYERIEGDVFPPECSLATIALIARATEKLHHNGLVHGDMRLSNVVLVDPTPKEIKDLTTEESQDAKAKDKKEMLKWLSNGCTKLPKIIDYCLSGPPETTFYPPGFNTDLPDVERHPDAKENEPLKAIHDVYAVLSFIRLYNFGTEVKNSVVKTLGMLGKSGSTSKPSQGGKSSQQSCNSVWQPFWELLKRLKEKNADLDFFGDYKKSSSFSTLNV